VRASQPPAEIAAIVRHIVSTIDVNQAIAGVATIGALVDRSAARERFNMVMLLWFAGCALILTATGTYSVIAESVAERRREIAIKMALGARKTRIVGEIVRRALIYSLAGTVVGGCAIVALGQLGSEMLYRTTPYDPVILATVLSVLFLTAVTAAWWPAWVAAGRDPQTALGRI
jgi:ABC-type antimicrobial peptide transport system permease subunit